MGNVTTPSVAGQRVTVKGTEHTVLPTEGGWLVSSATQVGFWRVRQPAPGTRSLMCPCPGWLFRGRCRHLEAVALATAAAEAA